MIKLTLPPKPVELTKDKQVELTSKFKANPKAEVWKQSWIVTPLMTMTFGKCAYSEMRLGEEGKYAQIDHFYPKSRYPNEVVDWGNLIPSCNVCNSKKSTLDTKRTPIVNPLIDNPKDFFYIKNGRLNAKDIHCVKAVNTLIYCDLNNTDQFRKKRLAIEAYLKKRLKEIVDTFPFDKDRWRNELLILMKESGRTAAYSATKSTFILSNSDYLQFKQQLIEANLWDKRYYEAEEELKYCSLPI